MPNKLENALNFENFQRLPPPSDATTSTSKILEHSNLPKNQRFNKTGSYKYKLYLQQKTRGTNLKAQATDYLIAQHIYKAYYKHSIHHNYKPDDSKETINSVFRGTHKEIGNTILSNK